MPELHHAPVAFGLIVGEGNRRVVKEAQGVLFARCETQDEIMSGSARRTAAPFAASLIAAGASGIWASWKASPSARMAS